MKLLQRDQCEEFMYESYILSNIAAMNWLKRESLKYTKSLYMKDSNKQCSFETIMIWDLKEHTKKCMKEFNFLVHIAHMKQLQMEHLQNTGRKHMKVWNTLVNIAATKQLESLKERNANIAAMKQL